MAFPLSKKKPKAPKKVVESKECCSFITIAFRFLNKVPIVVSLLLLVYLWSSSSTIISGKIVHVCVSTRKLNSLYCLSAGAQPNFEIPVVNTTDINGLSRLETKKETPSLDIDNRGIDSPVVNETLFSVVDSITIDGSIVDNGEVKKEETVPELIRDENNPSPDIHNTPIDSPVALLSVVDNTTIDGSIVNDGEVKKEDIVPELTRDENNPSPDIDNTTIDSPVALLSVVDNTTIDGTIVNHGEATKEEIVYEGEGDEVDPMIAVEDSIRALRSYTSKERREGCEGRGIYVYDLPSKFNKDLIGQCSDMIPRMDCKYFDNDGLGEPIPSLGPAWYRTHQYSLEPIFHSRILKHPCRVHNEDEAKLFYVPFYGGVDILRWHFKNVSDDVKDSLGLELIKWLERQRPWGRNSGKDHVFVLGKISWDFRRKQEVTWGTRLLELEAMQNPAKILIERQPWHDNDIGVPHPTYFHPRSDEDIVTWQAKIISSNRGSLVGFAGAARPGAPENIRSILIEQCSRVEDHKCRFLDCYSGACSRPESVIELFMESEFCLQPPGDSPTRKSVFDSLVSGCIPVLFDPFTAFYQYPWHLPEDHRKYSVFIDQKEVRQMEVKVVEALMKVSKKERDDMRRFIVYELLPGLVYGDIDSKLERFQDSFSITINSLLERVNSLGSS